MSNPNHDPANGQFTDGSGGGAATNQRVRDAFKKLSNHDSVRLNKLREHLSDVPRAELDRALLDMQKSGEANLMHLDNPRDIKAVGDAALKRGVENYHTVWLDKPSAPAVHQPSTPLPGKSAAPNSSDYSKWLNGLLK